MNENAPARTAGTETALVLGGGGMAGFAWETGILLGLQEADADVTNADLLVGTSAGSLACARLASAIPLPTLYAQIVDPDLPVDRIAAQAAKTAPELMADSAKIFAESSSVEEARRRIGQHALESETVPEAARRALFETVVPERAWPERDIWITAVDVFTGEPVVITRDSPADMIDACLASTAVPGAYPPATIGGSRFMDGGARTMTNYDLVADQFTMTVVIAPLVEPHLPGEIAQRVSTGQRILLITPSASALDAFGDDVLSVDSRIPSAQAGRVQGRSVAAAVAAIWNP